jgi:hypothetical protein
MVTNVLIIFYYRFTLSFENRLLMGCGRHEFPDSENPIPKVLKKYLILFTALQFIGEKRLENISRQSLMEISLLPTVNIRTQHSSSRNDKSFVSTVVFSSVCYRIFGACVVGVLSTQQLN